MPNNTSVFRFGGLPFPAGRRIGPALCFLLLLAWSCPWAVSAAPADPPRAPSTVYASSPSLAPGAITVHPYGQMQQSDSLDDYDTAPVDSISDPLEPWNRFWFRFNDIFYLHVARPAYDAWVFITPHQLRSGLKNFFSNVMFPMRFVNNILQFRFLEAGVEFGRFFINTTSSLGFADVAKGSELSLRFNALGDVLPLYEDLNNAAVDPYIAMREAYINFRNSQVKH